MNLSRTHIAFLAIISIFTGLIWPGTHAGNRYISYLMTDAKLLAYIMLATLIVAFYSAATRWWKWFRICSVIIFLGIGILLFFTIFWRIHTENDFAIISGLSWGWIFLFIGCALLIWAYGQRDYWNSDNSFADTIDGIIGILWWFALACIVWGIILSSLTFFSHPQKPSILVELFGSGNTYTLSWWIHISKLYNNIITFSYDRKWDVLTVVSATWANIITQTMSGENIFYSSGNTLKNIVSEKNEFYEVWKVWNSLNWVHSMSGVESNGKKKLIFDGDLLWRDLEEVREIFIGNDWSYAYFGRPLWETKYCLFTRYKWNKCGLSGYMNPRVWADGNSIIYAGYADNSWSIFRNSDKIIQNTGYDSQDNSHDYVFFDTTNPRTFLFIKKDMKTWQYIYIKNGITMPWSWYDAGTKVDFWFDNHIITTAKDEKWWRVIEF